MGAVGSVLRQWKEFGDDTTFFMKRNAGETYHPIVIGTPENITVTLDVATWLIECITNESKAALSNQTERNSFNRTPVVAWANACSTTSMICSAASAGANPAGRILDMQFRFESMVPTCGRQVM